jgi:membrane associated rhomboid family serine protease
MSDAQAGPEARPPHCYRHPDRETWIRCQRCDRPICPDCMHSASVGFQCPECVKEGARSTRTGRLPYGGSRVANPQLTTIGLIAVNVFVWLLIRATGGDGSSLLDKLALTPRGACQVGDSDRYYPQVHSAALCVQGRNTHWVSGVADGSYWQLLTSAFSHVEVLHIGFNMVALFFLGPPLEALLGRTRFLAVYGVAALTGSAAVMLFSDPATATLGASGAIFGLMGALAVVGLRVGADLQQLWLWIGLNLVFTFTAGGISWQGHIGGLIGGAACAAVLAYAPKQNRTSVQTVGLAAIAGVAIVLTLVRATALA